MSAHAVVQVAVGVIKNAQQQVLIALRPAHVHQGGLWEFPGGKVEKNETLQECLKRELFEELNIIAEVGEYFCTSSFKYKDILFDMCMFKVFNYQGEIKLNEHSAILWVTRAELSN